MKGCVCVVREVLDEWCVREVMYLVFYMVLLVFFLFSSPNSFIHSYGLVHVVQLILIHSFFQFFQFLDVRRKSSSRLIVIGLDSVTTLQRLNFEDSVCRRLSLSSLLSQC